MVEAQKEKPKRELEGVVPKPRLAEREAVTYYIRMRGCKAGNGPYSREYVLEFYSPKPYSAYGDTENERLANFYKYISANNTRSKTGVVGTAAAAYRMAPTGLEKTEVREVLKLMVSQGGHFSPEFHSQRMAKKAAG